MNMVIYITILYEYGYIHIKYTNISIECTNVLVEDFDNQSIPITIWYWILLKIYIPILIWYQKNDTIPTLVITLILSHALQAL